MNYPSDGEIVFGGYNSNHVNGTFANFSMANSYLDQPCPLQVLLKDVRVTMLNGTSNTLMTDGEARVPACINPVENGFQFTPAMYKVWASLTQHPSNPPSDGSHNYTQQTYPLSSEPLLNELIIELDGGYQVTIPHYELVSFERGNDAQGLYAVINSSRIQSAVTDNGGRFTFPILGGVFLSQNYLNVDYNRNVFGLAHAITSTPSNTTVTSTCKEGVEAIAPPSSTPSTSPSNSPTPSVSSSSGKALSTGAIVGIVIGGLLGLLLIAGFAVYLHRKSQNRKKLPRHIVPYDGDTTAHLSPTRQMSEMEGDSVGGTRHQSVPESTFRNGFQPQAGLSSRSDMFSPSSPQQRVERWNEEVSPNGPALTNFATVPGSPPRSDRN